MDKVIIDISAVMERVDNDLELLETLMEILKSDAPQKVSALREAVATRNASEVRELAHSLKSALGNLGSVIAYRIAVELEKAALQVQFDRLQPLLGELEEAIQEFYTEFDRIRPTLSQV